MTTERMMEIARAYRAQAYSIRDRDRRNRWHAIADLWAYTASGEMITAVAQRLSQIYVATPRASLWILREVESLQEWRGGQFEKTDPHYHLREKENA